MSGHMVQVSLELSPSQVARTLSIGLCNCLLTMIFIDIHLVLLDDVINLYAMSLDC